MSNAPEQKVGQKIAKQGQSESARERQSREEGLDQTVEDSFPSSDPPSTIPDPEAPDSNEKNPRAA